MKEEIENTACNGVVDKIKSMNSESSKMTLTKLTKFGYGVGHVLNDLCASVWFTYALFYYNTVVGVNNTDAGLLLTIGQIADGLATPIVGLLSDRVVLSKRLYASYGRRKTWHLIGTIGIVLTMPFMFTPSPNYSTTSYTVKMVYYCTLIIIFQICWAIVQISHLSLAPELSLDANDRTLLLSLRTMFAVLSNITVYSVAWGVLAVDSTGMPNHGLSSADLKQFMIIVYSIVAVGLLMSFLFHVTVKEVEMGHERLVPLPERQPIRSLFGRISLYQVAVVYMCARLFGNMTQVLITFYVQAIMTIGPQSIAVVPFVMYIASFLTSLFVGPLNKRFGRKIPFLYGSLVGSGGVLAIAFGRGDIYATYIVYITAILLGSCQSTYLITSLAIIADLIGLDVGNGAFIYGIMSLTDKISSGVAIIVVQTLKPRDPGLYFQWALVITCGSSIALGTFMILTIVALRRRSQIMEDVPSEVQHTS